MLAKDLRAKSRDDLIKELLGLREEEFNLRMQRASNQLASPARFGAVRKDIARIKTVLNELKADDADDASKAAPATAKKAAAPAKKVAKKAAKKKVAKKTAAKSASAEDTAEKPADTKG